MTILTKSENRKRKKIQAYITDAETVVKKYFADGKECPRGIYERYANRVNAKSICYKFYITIDTLQRFMQPDVITEEDIENNRPSSIKPIQLISDAIPFIGVKDKRPYCRKHKTKADIILQRRISAFLRRGNNPSTFTIQDLLNKFGEHPRCALSGRNIDYSDGTTYHFDHIIPVRRGGEATLNNLQLVSPQVNAIKCAMSVDEYIQLCRDVVKYQDVKS